MFEISYIKKTIPFRKGLIGIISSKNGFVVGNYIYGKKVFLAKKLIEEIDSGEYMWNEEYYGDFVLIERDRVAFVDRNRKEGKIELVTDAKYQYIGEGKVKKQILSRLGRKIISEEEISIFLSEFYIGEKMFDFIVTNQCPSGYLDCVYFCGIGYHHRLKIDGEFVAKKELDSSLLEKYPIGTKGKVLIKFYRLGNEIQIAKAERILESENILPYVKTVIVDKKSLKFYLVTINREENFSKDYLDDTFTVLEEYEPEELNSSKIMEIEHEITNLDKNCPLKIKPDFGKSKVAEFIIKKYKIQSQNSDKEKYLWIYDKNQQRAIQSSLFETLEYKSYKIIVFSKNPEYSQKQNFIFDKILDIINSGCLYKIRYKTSDTIYWLQEVSVKENFEVMKFQYDSLDNDLKMLFQNRVFKFDSKIKVQFADYDYNFENYSVIDISGVKFFAKFDSENIYIPLRGTLENGFNFYNLLEHLSKAKEYQTEIKFNLSDLILNEEIKTLFDLLFYPKLIVLKIDDEIHYFSQDLILLDNLFEYIISPELIFYDFETFLKKYYEKIWFRFYIERVEDSEEIVSDYISNTELFTPEEFILQMNVYRIYKVEMDIQSEKVDIECELIAKYLSEYITKDCYLNNFNEVMLAELEEKLNFEIQNQIQKI